MSTFVSVGNTTQPFDRLLEAVTAVVRDLPQPVFVQCGSTPFHAKGCENVAFLNMSEFQSRVGQSTLVIMHAGAGSLITALRSDKVPVVMARRARYGEHVDDHQIELARELDRVGRIVVANEPADLLPSVREALARQESAHRATPASPAMIEMIADVLHRYANP